MTNRIGSLAVVGVVLVLSACTFSGTRTAPAPHVASSAEDVLEERTGVRPEIDCGTQQVKLVGGTLVDCILTEPASGDRYKAPVLISDVDGSDFSVKVNVAEDPVGSTPPPEPTQTALPIPEDAPIATGVVLAELVEQAIASELDYVPIVSCFLDTAIVVGNTADCILTDGEGDVRDVLVEITEFDGANYSISATFVD